jgi:hypothetical protein
MKTPSNSQNEPDHNRHNITTDTSLSTEENTREAAAEEYRRIARESGIQTRESHGEPRLGGHQSGTNPKGNIRFSHFTKKPKTSDA